MQRSDASERLDGPLLDAAVLRGNLRDLERVNRWLGGTTLSRRAIERLAGDRPAVELLDVGTASTAARRSSRGPWRADRTSPRPLG
jgi:hypothetical protein